MVNEGRGRLFMRKDGKFLIYIPKALAEDSMFPFRKMQASPRSEGAEDATSVFVKVSFKVGGEPQLLVEKWVEPEKASTE